MISIFRYVDNISCHTCTEYLTGYTLYCSVWSVYIPGGCSGQSGLIEPGIKGGRGRGTFTTQPHCISFDIPHTWHLWDTLHFIGKVVPLYLIRFQRGTWHWISNQYYKIVILRQCEQNYEGRLSSILQMRTDIWQKLHWYMRCIATLETKSLENLIGYKLERFTQTSEIEFLKI